MGTFFVTLLILFLFINIVAYHIILRKTELSIYDSEKYWKYKTSFYKDLNKGSLPHPFFGLGAQGRCSFQNNLSNESLFDTISELLETQ
jgi:hypothetical protein